MPSEEETYRRSIDRSLQQILAQTTKTNGRVTRLEKQVLIALTAIAVMVALKAPEVVPLLHLAIG